MRRTVDVTLRPDEEYRVHVVFAPSAVCECHATLKVRQYQPAYKYTVSGHQGLRVVSSKHPKLGLMQELSSRISESTTGYTFTLSVGSFTSTDIDTERHRQMWGERNCLNFEMAVGGIEPQVWV